MGGIWLCLPLSSHRQWPIQPHSSLKQHVNIIKIFKNTQCLSGNSAHDCQNTFSFKGTLQMGSDKKWICASADVASGLRMGLALGLGLELGIGLGLATGLGEGLN